MFALDVIVVVDDGLASLERRAVRVRRRLPRVSSHYISGPGGWAGGWMDGPQTDIMCSSPPWQASPTEMLAKWRTDVKLWSLGDRARPVRSDSVSCVCNQLFLRSLGVDTRIAE